MAQVKGTVFVTTRTWVLTRAGEEGWRRVLSALTPEDRAVVETALPVGWYDLLVEDRLNRVVDRTLGRGDLALMALIGRFGAEHEMKSFYRFFLKALTPANVVERGTEFWRRYQDTGTWATSREGTRVRAALHDWGSKDVATHIRLTAYLGRLIEMTGAHNTKIEHSRCRLRGDAYCEFTGSWEI